MAREQDDRTQGMPINSKLIRIIQTGKSRLLYTEPQYRELLQQRYGVHSTKELTETQAEDLIDYFRLLGFGKKKRKWTCTLCHPRPRRNDIPDGTIYPVSLGQEIVIRVLKDKVRWNHPQGYERWLLKYFGLTVIQTSLDASRVITALKGLLRSQKTCTGCAWKFTIEAPNDAGKAL